MTENEKYIGVFDSGIGGLTVVKSIVETMPNENIIYFGDTAHVPYGTRSKEQITEYVLSDVKFLSRFSLKAVVIACNTADSAARENVEEKYSDLPVYGVVAPASRKAAELTKNNKVGVIATNATVNSGAYEKTIHGYSPDIRVISLACPLLVPLVEEGRFKKGDKVIEQVLKEYLTPLKEQGIDTLVLGCTHYPLLYDVITEIMGGGVTVISSSVAAAEELKKGLKEKNLLSETADSERKYFVSDNAEAFKNHALIFMGDSLGGAVEQVDIEE